MSVYLEGYDVFWGAGSRNQTDEYNHCLEPVAKAVIVFIYRFRDLWPGRSFF